MWSGRKIKHRFLVLSDWVKVNANYQNKSLLLSVVKDNEFRHTAGAIQQASEYEVWNSRERWGIEIKMWGAYIHEGTDTDRWDCPDKVYSFKKVAPTGVAKWVGSHPANQ